MTSRISAYAAKLEWEFFKEWGFRREEARDPWALLPLIRRGELDKDQIEAALKYARLLETQDLTSQPSWEPRTGGGGPDGRHRAKMRIVAAQRAAEVARAEVWRMCRRDHAMIFDHVFSHPHPKLAHVADRAGVDNRAVARAMKASLTRLWAHWRGEEA